MSTDEENMAAFTRGLFATDEDEAAASHSNKGNYVAKEGANPAHPSESNMKEFIRDLFDVPN